jgi:sulfur-oxidizing protein SoxA
MLATVTGARAQVPPLNELVPADKRSGSAFQAGQTRAMQSDPMGNPGLLWVSQGETLWHESPPGGSSCQDCHGDAASSMRGVAARYPAVDADGRLLNLEARINHCRTLRQEAPAFAYESDPLLSLTAFVAHQSQGLPVSVSIDGAARGWFERGRDFFATRQGQLNLACRHCHQQNWGRYLRGDRVSQGHGNGYPAYRLQWQTVGSLHRRFKACSAGVRATMYDYGSDEYLALELFLAWRAGGLPLETPAVRR